MKNMKQKLLSIMFILTLTLGPCMMAMATGSTGATRNALKSQGNIVYTDGENSVEIYADDLYTIADKLDSYKTSIANQLGKIHTYFTSNTGNGTGTVTDGKVNITHTTPASADTVDPLAMDFDTLLEGLAASQSIPTDVTEYGYSSGQKLYKTTNGSLTTTGSGTTQINIAAATASNLSAGTASWVNGNLILGTGEDNSSYYSSGYNKGYNSGYSYGYSNGVSSSSGSGSVTFCGTVNSSTSVTLSSGYTYCMTWFRYGKANVSSTPDSLELSSYITGDYTTVYNQKLRVIQTNDNDTHRKHAIYSVVLKANSSCTVSVESSQAHCAHIYRIG